MLNVVKENRQNISTVLKNWTPSLSSTGTSPSGWSGNNTASVYQVYGDLVIGRGQLDHATNASQGTGTWLVSLPVTPKHADHNQVVGEYYYYDSGLFSHGHIYLYSSSQSSNNAKFGTILYNSNAGIDFLGPGTLTNDYSDAASLSFTFVYEALK